MKETHINNQPIDFDDEINLQRLFNILLKDKWIILSLSTFISIIGVIYSLLLPNIYESKALLAPVNPSSSISGALGSYSAVAGLAGVNLPTGNDGGNSEKAIKKIASLSFFENNVLPNINLPNLMAVKSWNSNTNTVFFDESIYDVGNDMWNRDFSNQEQQIPSAQDSFLVFRSKHLSLSKDKITGFITLSIKHQSPYLAKQWTELIVDEINAYYRQKDRLESEKAVSYLNQQISMTGLSEIKQVLAELLQEETKKLTLVEANKYYVFDYIDPPAVMEKKSEPNRALICIFFGILGGLLSIFFLLLRYFYNSKELYRL